MAFLKINRDQLLGPLQAVAGIVETRTPMPVLLNVLMERAGTRLTLVCNDLEVQMRTVLDGLPPGDTEATTVGARKLVDILRAMPGDCALTLSVDEQRMSIRGAGSRFSLQTLPAASYPTLNLPETSVRLNLSQGRMRSLLSHVTYAMAVQDIRYYLNGLLLVAEGDQLKAVATDGHRLAYAVTTLDNAVEGRHETILPRKTALQLARQLPDSDDALEVGFDRAQIVFRFGSIEFLSKLIDGRFPDYERVIPAAHPRSVLLDRVTIAAALQRAAILTSDKFRGVRILLNDGMLKVISTNADQEEAIEEMAVDYSDQPLEMGFNVVYLLDVLNHLDTERVMWRCNDNNSSILVTRPEDDDFKYVLMPMRI